MKIAILSANLGNFDTMPVDPVEQVFSRGGNEVSFHRFTDKDFPPITGMSPRFQYRIPKLFGYEMMPDYDIYIWLDSAYTFAVSDAAYWYLHNLKEADVAFFAHPWRSSIREEVEHIEEKLEERSPYIVSRYKGGLHREAYTYFKKQDRFKDNRLFASTSFIYRNNDRARLFLQLWWQFQSRYYSCDQVALPFAMFKTPGLTVNTLPGDVFKNEYLSICSPHK